MTSCVFVLKRAGSVANVENYGILTLESLTRDGIICQSNEVNWEAFEEGEAAKQAFCGFFKRLALRVSLDDFVIVGFDFGNLGLRQNEINYLVLKDGRFYASHQFLIAAVVFNNFFRLLIS